MRTLNCEKRTEGRVTAKRPRPLYSAARHVSVSVQTHRARVSHPSEAAWAHWKGPRQQENAWVAERHASGLVLRCPQRCRLLSRVVGNHGCTMATRVALARCSVASPVSRRPSSRRGLLLSQAVRVLRAAAALDRSDRTGVLAVSSGAQRAPLSTLVVHEGACCAPTCLSRCHGVWWHVAACTHRRLRF